MEWLKNLSSAIEYIENNLDNEISCEEAAKIACCSPVFGKMKVSQKVSKMLAPQMA